MTGIGAKIKSERTHIHQVYTYGISNSIKTHFGEKNCVTGGLKGPQKWDPPLGEPPKQ